MSDYLKVLIENDGYLSNLTPSPDRSYVLEVSTRVESIITYLLAITLRVENYENTPSFGDKGLSFYTKLNLFLDLKGIKKEQKVVLVSFLFIRNKFAHRPDLKSFHDVFSSNDDERKIIERRYKERIKCYEFNETNSAHLFKYLLEDIEVILLELFGSLTEEVYREGADKFNANWNKTFKENILNPSNQSTPEIMQFVTNMFKKTNEAYSSSANMGE